jgi:hypothetical protein
MSKDLTKLSRKELESKLAKKYGVEKYLNQRSQLLSLLNTKGETDIETGFTGPETEALSIMFENSPAIGSRSKAEGGIVSLSLGSGEFDDTDSLDGQDFSGGGFDEADDEDESRAGDYQTTTDTVESKTGGDDVQSTVFSGLRGDDILKEIENNPQLKGFLGDKMRSLVKEGKISNLERDDRGRLTGMYSESSLPGMLGGLASLLDIPIKGKVYTGYGEGFNIGGSDDGDDTSQMIRKISQQKKEEKKDTPLTQAEIDYYTRGMGTATKPLKTLEDVNKHMASLVGTTESPTGAKLSKDKQFLVLPNGKIINLKTGRVQESMSGLELFRGGMI